MLSGYKTYLLAALGAVWAVSGWLLGYLEPQRAMEILWASLTSAALRAGIAKNAPEPDPH